MFYTFIFIVTNKKALVYFVVSFYATNALSFD